MSVLCEFLETIRKPAHLLVAISGGSDSTGLLIGLHACLSSFPDIRLSAVTIDHALRHEAAEEAQTVARLCAGLGIFHVTRRWEGEKPVTGLAAAAREARYTLLSAIADEIGATAIVTGHTADDQIETAVMRRERRSGLASPSAQRPANAAAHPSPSAVENEPLDFPSHGLAGMARATLLDGRHWILRPLLATGRADIRAFLTANGRGWIDDPSNLDRRSERVRIRQTLADGNARLDAETIATAGRMRADLAQRAADWLAAHAAVERAIVCRIDPAGLAADPATVRHALSVLAAVLGGRAHLLSRDHADGLMNFMKGGAPGRMTAGRVVFDRRRDGLFLLRENRNLPHLLVEPGQTATWDNRFRIENRMARPVDIRGGGEDAVFRFAPDGIANLAKRVTPHVAEGDRDGVIVTPHLALFDRFLPVFDLPLASATAVLMGRPPYLLPPV
ncbi:tRNA lysidine(34) synthetase TilS [Neorhizobium sp. NPDC001467]|uniref:tRNA lysidine(34) synthetase TilS n=1 Tax=Neorhizobium sp. NPDC001467 TaxID=3390595 RepID=UPI003D04F489